MKKSIVQVLMMTFVILCPGCLLHQLNVGHYDSYFEGGSRAFDVGDYSTAKKRFIKAYNYAHEAALGARAEAAALYNYALASGMLGDFPEAEKALKATLSLDEKTAGPAGPLASLRWLELARLYQAWGKPALCVSAYETGISLIKKYGREKDDPAAYAITLEDYAEELNNLGQKKDAQQLEMEAKKIRETHPDARTKAKFLHYPSQLRKDPSNAQ
jgi:tetratricopeptide (TPR) repeat protein